MSQPASGFLEMLGSVAQALSPFKGPDVEGVGAAEVMGALEQMFGLDPTNGEDSDEGEGEEGDES